MGFNTQALSNNSTAVGAIAAVASTHHRSSAFGFRAETTAADQMVFGTDDGATGPSDNNRIAWTNTASYRFAGFAIDHNTLAQEAADLDEVTDLASLTGDQYNARVSRVNELRGAAANRVLGLNGHGTLVSLGNMSDFRYDDAEVRGLIGGNATRIATSERAISDLDTRLTARADTNAQGVALSNALSAIPNTLSPGKKLFLGLGVGSFDGKSATAIGVTGKFGASTLLNAGFATGSGESSTRLGIGWEW